MNSDPLLTVISMQAMAGPQAVSEYWARRAESGEMTPGSVARYTRILAAFIRFSAAHGCRSMAEADPALCLAFVFAAQRNGALPSTATSRFRLTVVRDSYLALAGAIEDPTEGLRVPQAPQTRKVVPLVPAEASRLRSSARTSPRDQLRPAAVELALLGGSHHEVARVVVSGVDLAAESVLLGSRRVELDPTAASVLAARVAACRRAARRREVAWEPNRVAIALSRPLDTYPETSIAPGVSSSLSRALAKAGITRPGVRASSIREYAANRAYALTRRVEDVAGVLGLDSLDAAMGYIDAGWQDRHGDEVRG